MSLLNTTRYVWERARKALGIASRGDNGLQPANRRFKEELLAIDLRSADGERANSSAFAEEIAELLRDPGFVLLPPDERAWVFAQIEHIFAQTKHSSGKSLIEAVEPQLEALADDPSPHLTALCTAYDLLYFLYWCWNNSIDEQVSFGTNVVRPFSAAIRRSSPVVEANLRPLRDKPVVGLLAQLLSPTPGNALATVNQLILRSILASGYRAVLFAWAAYDPETIAKVEALGVEVFAIPRSSATNSVERCISDTETAIRNVDPDVLITEMNSAIPAVLFERRVARVQIYSQHGLPFWPLKNIDAIFNHWGIAPEKYGIAPERCFSLPTPFDLPEYRQSIDPEVVKAERAKFPPGKLIGCYGRISKVTPAYVRAAARIVEGLDDVTVLIGGAGDARPVRRAVEETGLGHKFVIVEGFVDGQLWGYLLDVFLDTYPQPGGLAVMEAIAKGMPIVYMEDPNVPSFSEFKAPALTAFDEDGYVEIARKLLVDNSFYQEMVAGTRSLSEGRPGEENYAAAMGAAIRASLSRYAADRADGKGRVL